MKPFMFFFSCMLWLSSATTFAQTGKVNDLCDKKDCSPGLFCVKTRDGQMKCATCNQSKLDDLTNKLDNACKTFDNLHTDKGRTYQDGLASDGRVQVDVYDEMLELGKKCREARETREKACWAGGDEGHAGQIEKTTKSIVNVSNQKDAAIKDRKVFYCSKSTYESKLGSFNSKCKSSDLEKWEGDLKKLEDSYNKIASSSSSTDKINCSEIETIIRNCEYASEAAEILMKDCYKNNTDLFPKEYFNRWDQSEKVLKKAQDLLKKVKDKSRCR